MRFEKIFYKLIPSSKAVVEKIDMSPIYVGFTNL